MCGITGIYNHNQDIKISLAELKKMNSAIKHRGPDGEGFFVHENIGFGHRRLKIIDLTKSSSQPLYSEYKDIVLVCNGEIYNYQELKEALINKGHEFGSNGDNEVILHLYEEYGENSFNKLEGMFAFALWDKKKKRLFLVRDRLGIKPLFYYVDKQGVIFSSEIKGILSNHRYKKEIEPEALHFYFFHNHIAKPKTIFKNIVSVEPAEYLIFTQKNKTPVKKKYWDPNFCESKFKDENEIYNKFKNILESSIKKQIISSAPAGAALSGGIDSSILVALLNKFSKGPVRTYSFSFENDNIIKKNDYRTSLQVSKIFNTDHETYNLKPIDVINNLEKISFACDEPVCSFSFIYYLCLKARKDVKVIFTGDGTEELFGKYWNHRLALGMKNILTHLDKREKIKLENTFIKNYSKIVAEKSWHFSGLFSFRHDDRMLLYNKDLLRKTNHFNTTNYLYNKYKLTKANDFFNKILEIDTKNFLPEHSLKIIDRCSMTNSIEARPPFLDHSLVDFMSTLPARIKYRAGSPKYLMRKLAGEMFPKKSNLNFQSGVTGPPISKWLTTDMESFVRDKLSISNLKKHDFFNSKYAISIINEHYKNKRSHISHDAYNFSNPELNHTIKIWKLLMFQIWWERVFNNS